MGKLEFVAGSLGAIFMLISAVWWVIQHRQESLKEKPLILEERMRID